MPFALLVSPLAHGAYYDGVERVAFAELLLHFPDCAPRAWSQGPLRFIDVDIPDAELERAARLSFVQGIFRRHEPPPQDSPRPDPTQRVGPPDGAPLLAPLGAGPNWTLPRELVYGAKYRGKTNELFTLLALNIARATCRLPAPTKVLDPMAGRGTTLLWAARSGLHAVGIEQDPACIDDMQRHVRKHCKLLRVRHKETKGTVGRRNAKGRGNFVAYAFDAARVRLIVGDTRDAAQLLQQERFPMMVSDLPYGVQHTGPQGRRDPSAVLRGCAPVWAERLLPGGSLVLGFNAFMPKRDVLMSIFADAGLEPHAFTAPHRMSAAIQRDLAVFTRPLPAEPSP